MWFELPFYSVAHRPLKDSPLVYQTCYICLNSNLDLNWELHNSHISFSLQSNWRLNENINFWVSWVQMANTLYCILSYPFDLRFIMGAIFLTPGNIWYTWRHFWFPNQGGGYYISNRELLNIHTTHRKTLPPSTHSQATNLSIVLSLRNLILE